MWWEWCEREGGKGKEEEGTMKERQRWMKEKVEISRGDMRELVMYHHASSSLEHFDK